MTQSETAPRETGYADQTEQRALQKKQSGEAPPFDPEAGDTHDEGIVPTPRPDLLVQVNTDNSMEGHEALTDQVETTLRDRFSRYSDKITRVEVHLGDVSGGANDKRCMIEVRPTGLAPVVASEEAGTIVQAVSAAAAKAVSALETTFGKLTSRKGH